MSVTKTSLKYSYEDALGVGGNSKTYPNISTSVTNAQAQALGTALTTNDVYPGGISAITKIEKISTTTDEIPLS